MADIFLSYAREDKDRARFYAQALEAAGWTVFWDSRILPGTSWDEAIEEHLEGCKCVVVLWSVVSVKSKWVKNEATVGDDRNVLVPVSLDATPPPLAFRHRQSAQLQQWTGDARDEGFVHLLDGIARHVPRPNATPERSRGEAKPLRESDLAPPPGPPRLSEQTTRASPTRWRPSAALPPGPARLSEQTTRASPPRFRPDAWNLPDEGDLGFIEVPAGSFTMGSDKSRDGQAFHNELPQHQVTLPAFLIARYEVTVAQFKACVNDGGCTPGDRQALEGADDLPVRYVSWHEALAYCGWLEARLKSWREAPAALADALAGSRGGGRAWHVTLPSEAEWERAARGEDGRVYPWGDRIDPTRANYDGAKRGGPTPVGSFPTGASPVGALDMSGNVWEWTRSRGAPYPYRADYGRERLDAGAGIPRVVRGGAFGGDGGGVRAALRGELSPTLRVNYLGFRVVVSPFSSESS